MATHSITAWKTLWTEEPGGLQSTGSQSRTWLSTHTHHHLASIVSNWVLVCPGEIINALLVKEKGKGHK